MGFTASQEEIACVFLDAMKTGYLEVDDFFKKLTCWKETTEKKVQIAKIGEIKRRPITASQATKQDLISSYSLGSQPVKVQGRPESAVTKATPLRSGRSLRVPDDNKSKHYLRLARLRQLEQERAAAEAAAQDKLKVEQDTLSKIQEATAIAKALRLPLGFSAVRRGGLLLVAQEATKYDAEGKERVERREVTVTEFTKAYNRLQRMVKSVRYTTQQAPATAKAVESCEIVRVNKAERKAEMRKALVDAVKLSKRLRDQLCVLEYCGVNK